MSNIEKSGTYVLGDRAVKRLGYGAMQLAGPGVFGPPKDRTEAVAVLREAVASGVNHIDTSDFYGPHVTNEIIREALHPYADDLLIVTKIGARRGPDKSWNPAFSAEDLTSAVHDNLRNLGLDVLDVVNLRFMFDVHGPAEGPIEAPLTALAERQRRALRPSHRPEQCHAEASHRRSQDLQGRLRSRTNTIWPIAMTTPSSTIWPAKASPMRRSSRSAVSRHCSRRHCPTWPPASRRPRCVALAWLLQRSPNILLIPGTSSRGHLRENLAAAELELPEDALKALDGDWKEGD